MKEIGGFFELELNQKSKEFHKYSIILNSARNCLRYILETRKIKKIYIPYYTCGVILEPINALNLKFEYYKINKNFMPVVNFNLKKGEYLLYINYFGINQKNVLELTKSYRNIIVDNSQAFFDNPIKGIDTFYSPRKFFGVPDGGYLYTNTILERNFKLDKSYKRFEHLLKRIDESPETAYKLFLKNEKRLTNRPIKRMSVITQRLLSSINYEHIKRTRYKNFLYLHKYLSDLNEIDIETRYIEAPLAYPFLIKKGELWQYLIENKIYTATYWKDVKKIVNKDSLEAQLASYLIPLPIDQRYSIKHMKFMIKKIKEYLI